MRFEAGKAYGAWDTGTPPIRVISRTEHMALVEDTDTVERWKMKIKKRTNGTEYMTDSRVPVAWRECYTYEAGFKI